ncbi:hypothetical protein AB1Y20_005148 [Prymnesium parvum]|uniref:Na+/H+ antiporter NhaC-like C-terminal domain-containing protein n=1 Tax=Prymnesium parvum TaxID=97485 RepID=A0AB34J3H2_PRYPA
MVSLALFAPLVGALAPATLHRVGAPPLLRSASVVHAYHPALPSDHPFLHPHRACARTCPPRALLDVIGPRWLSLLPPLATLVASVLLRQVMLAMLFGIWCGALLVNGGNPLLALLRVFDTYTLQALAPPDHAGVVLFTVLLGGTIGLVQKSGGALGLANLVKGFFTSKRRGGFSAIALASLVFFDDYSSILIVGNSLRPLIASVGMSAAKFAYISHVLGVVFASLAPLSSWVGVQIGYLAGAYTMLPSLAATDPFVAFLSSIPYRFFPLTMLASIIAMVATGRDFGPMLEEEREACAAPPPPDADEPPPAAAAAALGPLDPNPGTPHRAINALLPFGVVLAASFSGMVYYGLREIALLPLKLQPAANLVNALRYADSVTALIWGSAAGWLAAMGLVLWQKLLSLNEAMSAWTEGTKEVLEPTFVLLLAWGLGAVIQDVGTADFLAMALQSGLPAWSLPALISLLCYAISFACGSSIGTMGIVFPLVGPLAYRMGGGSSAYVQQCFGAIMGGSLFGNLCSPISDTTILSVLATRCALATHVRTALAYCGVVGVVSLLFGDIAVGLGLYGPGIAVALCSAVVVLLKFVFGRVPDPR